MGWREDAKKDQLLGDVEEPQQARTPQYCRIRRKLVGWELAREGEHCVR